MKNYQLLNLNQIIKLTSLSKATIYRNIERGSFPCPIKISIRRVAWRESDISQWIAIHSYSSFFKNGGMNND